MGERSDIANIRDALTRRFPNSRVIVQPHSHRGINLKIVSEMFADESADRRGMVDEALRGIGLSLDDETFRFVELLTPEEDEWFGTNLADLEPEQLPFWAHAVAERKEQPSIEFATEDLPRPPIVTFYSFKGGVGRSTALVAAARLLARRRRRVIAVDMDLEAPGLPELFGVKWQSERQKAGLVELLNRLETGENVDVRDYLMEVDENLYLLPAGQLRPSYLEQLQSVDMPRYFRLADNPLAALFDRLQQLVPKPDFILVDARTGLTDISAPLLFRFSDVAIIVFHPHPQTKDGLDLLAKGLLSSRNQRGLTPEIRFVASMIPPSDVKNRIVESRAKEWIGEYVDEILKRWQPGGVSEFDLSADDIFLAVSYNEQIAFSASLGDERLWKPYEKICDWIDNLIEYQEEKDKNGDQNWIARVKESWLHAIKIQTGIAEDQPNLPDVYVKTPAYRQATDPLTALILGRKGTGKSALFRMLQETFGDQCVVIRHSNPEKDKIFHVSKEDLPTVEAMLPERNWTIFWKLFVLLKICEKFRSMLLFLSDEALRSWIEDNLEHSNKRFFLEKLGLLLKEPFLSSRLDEAFRQLHERSDRKLMLLWDGLDRDFGIEREQKERRSRVLTGLFYFWNLISDSDKLQAKIFLRKDIWEKIVFENKSHLYGRTMTLEWNNMFEFYKTLIKRIYQDSVRSDLKKHFLNVKKVVLPDNVDNWTEEQVMDVFHVLVTERMRGGKTAYTRNWIWSRLSDGKGNRSPRYLLQLFDKAVQLEREEHARSPHERSIIRSKLLVEAFHQISGEAVQAVTEEYEELKPLFEALYGKTAPFDYHSVPSDVMDPEIFETAVEAGVLIVYEHDDHGRPTRLTVPDLYLKGLGMSRRGQA